MWLFILNYKVANLQKISDLTIEWLKPVNSFFESAFIYLNSIDNLIMKYLLIYGLSFVNLCEFFVFFMKKLLHKVAQRIHKDSQYIKTPLLTQK